MGDPDYSPGWNPGKSQIHSSPTSHGVVIPHWYGITTPLLQDYKIGHPRYPRVSPCATIGIALQGLRSTGSTALILYQAASLEHTALLRDLWFVCNRNVNRYRT